MIRPGKPIPSAIHCLLLMNTDILAEWRLRERHRKQPFITGGVIDPAKWEGAPRKVLFLLKEAYDTSPASQGFDLCELVRDRWKGPRGRTWFQIGRWAHLIQHSKPATIPAYPNSRCEITEAVVASAAYSPMWLSAEASGTLCATCGRVPSFSRPVTFRRPATRLSTFGTQP